MLFSCGESDIIDPNLSGNIGTPDNNILTTVYVALGGLDQIAVFEANSESGALTSIQTVEGIEFPVSLDKDPQGQYMYAAIFGGEGIMGSLEVYKINPDTGFLEQRSSVPVGNLDFHPRSVRAHPNGEFVYLVLDGLNFETDPDTRTNGKIVAYRLNRETGELFYINEQPVGRNPRRMTLSLSGKFLFVPNLEYDLIPDNTVSAFQIQSVTGSLSEMPAISTGNRRPIAVNAHPSDNQLLVSCIADTNGAPEGKTVILYSFNADTGVVQEVDSEASNGDGPRFALPSPDGNYVHVPLYSSSTAGTTGIATYVISGDTITLVEDVNVDDPGPLHMAWDPQGKFLFSANYGTANHPGSITVFEPNEMGLLQQRFNFSFGEGSLPFSVATHEIN